MTTKTELLINGNVVATKTTAPFLPFNYDTTGLSGSVTVAVREYIDGSLAGTTPVVNGTVEQGAYTPPANYEQEYKDWLIYVNSNGFELPSSTQQDLDNEKVLNLKTELVWDELDFLYMNEAVYSPLSYATNAYRVNFKDPGTFTRNADTGKEPTWVSGKGFKVLGGSGDFQYTGFTPSTDAVKSLDSDSSLIFKLFDVPETHAETVRIYGGRPAAGSDSGTIIARTEQDVMLAGLYQAANHTIDHNVSSTNLNINAHHHIANDGTETRLYNNGVNVYGFSIVRANAGESPTEQLEFGYMDVDTPSLTSADLGISYLMQGSNLRAKQDVIYSIMNGTY